MKPRPGPCSGARGSIHGQMSTTMYSAPTAVVASSTFSMSRSVAGSLEQNPGWSSSGLCHREAPLIRAAACAKFGASTKTLMSARAR